MRLDIDIIKWLKSHGRGYQTRVNALLRHAMNSRWAARHEDEALGQKAQAAYDGLHAKRESGSIKRIHADKLRARMKMIAVGTSAFTESLCLAITETLRSVPSKASRKMGASLVEHQGIKSSELP